MLKHRNVHRSLGCRTILVMILATLSPQTLFAQDTPTAQVEKSPASTSGEGIDETSKKANLADDTKPQTASTGPILTKAPKLTEFVKAAYPDEAKASKLAGDVILAITINLDGSVSDPEIVQPLSPELDAAALAAVAQFKFEPAEFDNAPAVVRIQYRYTFTLEQTVVQTPKVSETAVKTGRFAGTLFERGNKKKMVGVEVKVGESLSAFTDANGRFVFEEIPVGKITVEVEDTDFEAIISKEEIVENQETDVTYYVPRKGFDDAITVRAKRLKKEVVRRTVTVEEIRLIPGTNGDALGIVQNLPGAARSSFGNTELILRGGGQTQVYLNQQAIPLAFHFGGIRSTVASGLIDNIEIYPSNYGVEFGRINGGAVDVQLRRPKTDRIHVVVEADVFDAGALIEGPVGDNGAFAFAVRRSYFDVLFGLAVPDDAGITIETLPRYYDSQAIYDWRKGDHQLNLTVYGSSDRFEAVFDEPAEENPKVRGEAVFALEWIGAQTRLKSKLTDTLKNDLSIAWIKTNVDVRFGTLVDLDFEFHQWLIRDTLTYALSKDIKIRLGTDMDLASSDIYAYGAGGPPKEGSPENRGGTNDAIETEAKSEFQSIGFYSDLDYRVGPVRLIPGVRYDYIGATEEHFVQPRFTTRYEVAKGQVFKAGYGWYMQPPQNDELVIGDGVPPKSETSVHYALGYEYQFTELLDLDVSLFYKDFDNLVRQEKSQQIEYNNNGVGRAYGMELLLRHKMGTRFFGWLAYTLQRSERRDSADGEWRPFDVDQTHNLILIGQYKLTPKWSLGLRWRFVTGNPETPVVGSVYEVDDNSYVPIFGDINSARQPTFTQLDLRVDRTWTYDTWKLVGYLDIRNVLNEANGSDRIYSYDYAEEARSTEIPIVPSFGFRGTF